MKLAIVGSRTFNGYETLVTEVRYFLIGCRVLLSDVSYIISGGANGADTLAEIFAKQHQIPMEIFKPDWNKYGMRAGFIRNVKIVDNCDILIAFWDGRSKGTKHSIELAKQAGKIVKIIYG
jgi:hypothetical protein